MISIDVILRLFWLINKNLNIDWPKKKIRWRIASNSGKKVWIEFQKNDIIAMIEYEIFSNVNIYFNFFHINVKNSKKIKKITRSESIQTFVFDYNRTNEVFLLIVIKTVIVFFDKNQISFQYHTFLNVFNKKKQINCSNINRKILS